MSRLLSNIRVITKQISSTMIDLIKSGTSKRLLIEDLIRLVSTHETTRHTQVILLGLVFNTYRLSVDYFDFKLETKGTHNEQFLEFIVCSNGITLLSYKGFEHNKNKLNEEIKIPETIYHTLA